MHKNLDDASDPANARVWDFDLPLKSWWKLPLSSDYSAGLLYHEGANHRHFPSMMGYES
jgi:hypothetical protein